MKHILFRGQSLVELLLAIGLLSVILPALLLGIVTGRSGKAQQNQRLQGVALLKETTEVVRTIRETGWTSFATDGTFHPTLSGSVWSLAAGAETVGNFSRNVVISEVERDSAGAIISSGGAVDPSTKRVEITVSWTEPYASSISQTLYLSRFEIISYEDTTQAQFDEGVKTNTYTTNTDGGEVTLGAGGGGGDWCAPTMSITEQDLPKNGVANAISAIEGIVFAGTGDNASGVSFQKISFDSAVHPPDPEPGATFDGYKTNAVFGEANYAYLATDTNNEEIVIMSTTQYSDSPTNSKYLGIGTINLPNAEDGLGVYVLNNKAYALSSDQKLYIYDITTRSGPHTTVLNGTGLPLSGAGRKIVVEDIGANTYAFIVTNALTNQLKIVDVTNPASPSIVGQLTLGSSQAGIDLFVNPTGTRAYIATAYSAGKRNLFIVDTTTKNNPQEVCPQAGCAIANGYNTAGMNPKGITVVTGNRIIMVGTGGTHQYQVIRIENEQNPTSCAGLPYATGVNGVASVLQSNNYAYSYIITGDSSAELKIILGGAGGSYVTSGTYDSAIYESAFSTAFNAFEANVNKPANTDIKLKVAVADPPSGDCDDANFIFLGPNGDPDEYFEVGSTPGIIEGAIPLITSGSYVNPGKCFRYQYTLETEDSTATPVLNDMTVNFSP